MVMAHLRPERPLALALGGGGAFGIGFELGFLHALRASGLPVQQSPSIGVSAGGWAGAALVCDIGIARIEESWLWGGEHRRPDGRAPTLEMATHLFGTMRDGRVRTASVRLPSCRRMIARGDTDGLAVAVATTSAVPRLAAPQHLRGQRVYDGGVVFNASGDRAAAARALLVLAPIARGGPGVAALVYEQRVLAETAIWAAKHHGRTMIVRPDADVLAAGGGSTEEMLDVRSMRPSYEAAYDQGLRLASTVRARLHLDRSTLCA